ncbi:hypothetical protein Fmac_029075 [Flemingia macrophylla]|uniref:Uncharacterized protein n=1 Tax=Flemingia macrophylla TaxID=520843 RepID=A0ABD1L9G3_9FABA
MSSLSSITIFDDSDNIQEHRYAMERCMCIPCLGPNSRSTTLSKRFGMWERMQTPESEERWWGKGWGILREWSEAVAWPKWKTLIRRFKKNNRAIGYSKQGSFQYDPHSYARNFDDGNGQNPNEDHAYDFSSRYVSIPTSTKSSMDLGKDGPSFI